MNRHLAPAIAFLQTDFETTGLDEVGGEIVQVGIIGTDIDYRPLFEVDVVIQPTARTFELVEAQPFVKNMMTVNGLIDDIELGRRTELFPTLASVERDVISLIEKFSPTAEHKVTLSGSGVGTFDFQWIRQHMPALAPKLNYWPDDVGILRRKWRDATGEDLVEVDKDKTHRAFDDVNCHIEEARVYRDLFTRLGRLAGGGDLASVNALLEELEAREPALA